MSGPHTREERSISTSGAELYSALLGFLWGNTLFFQGVALVGRLGVPLDALPLQARMLLWLGGGMVALSGYRFSVLLFRFRSLRHRLICALLSTLQWSVVIFCNLQLLIDEPDYPTAAVGIGMNAWIAFTLATRRPIPPRGTDE